MSPVEADLRDFLSNRLEPWVWVLLTKLSDYLGRQGIESHVVGGLVRDALLGRTTADIDIALASDALEIAPRVADALGGKYVLLDDVNRVGRVVLAETGAASGRALRNIDFSTYTGSIEEDLARRDFTINAMAISLSRSHYGAYTPISPVAGRGDAVPSGLFLIIDPFHGRDDLGRGVIRVVTETAFTSDAVRLLRGVRLTAELGFSLDKDTEALTRRDSCLITGVAGERVREEVLRLLAIPQSERLWLYLEELGLLTAIFPELAETKGFEQPREHFWNVFDHSIRTVVAVDYLLRRGDWGYAGGEALAAVPWSAKLAKHFAGEISTGSTRRTLLKLAALLHDIAKPRTRTIDVGGRMRFLGHASEGAAVLVNMLEKLRFSTREIKLVETMVTHHLRPGQMSQNQLPTQRAIYRYFRDTGEAGIDILFLNLADHLAARGPNLSLSHWREHAQMVEYVLARHLEQQNMVRSPKLVDGNDLINIFGMSPGPRIGEILEAVREAQASGEVTTRQEALAFIEGVMKNHA